MIDAGALPALRILFEHNKPAIKKEACWAISNITAGTADQIKTVMEAGILPDLVNLMEVADFKIKKEACWAICNATSLQETNPEVIR